jgi:catechol 2,3-dioxygenase-like lactoylglutathione lyase family enzyme
MAMEKPAEWTFAVSIPAKDLDGTRKFYEGVLGFKAIQEDPAGISYRAGDSMIILYPTQFAGTAQHTIGGFLVDDVEATMKDLRSKGVEFEEYDMPGLKTENGVATLGDSRVAWFKDPEGNILSLNEYSSWG